MLVLRDVVSESTDGPSDTITLDYAKRRMSRQRAVLDSGEDVALLLPRGTILSDGALLRGDDGRLVVVRAAKEGVSRVRSTDLLLLTRAAYHLGNRHVPLEIRPGVVSYAHDHVLDELVRHLGLAPEFDEAPFEPEQGAYADGGHHGSDSAYPGPPSSGHGHSHGS
jgi:urease accessory protein